MASKNNKDIFEKTSKELLALLEKENSILPDEMEAGFREIQMEINRQKRKKTIHRLSYSAAAIACLILISAYVFFYAPSPGSDVVLPFDNQPIGDVKEVVLFTQNQNVVLENETEVEYNEEGEAAVKNQVISPVPSPAKTKEKKAPLNQIIVPNGKRSYLVLADGTRLSINSGSRVAYPAVFDQDKREIFVQGEVYLQVAHDIQRPFHVKAEGFDVRVLGTSFNVCAYKDDPESSIVLVDGSVEMISSKKETVKITPGQKLSISNQGLSVTEVDVNEYILWKDNILYLGNYKSCGEILTRLARRYDVTIEYDDRLEKSYIGGKLDVCERIEDVLDILSVSSRFTYEVKDNKIIVR